MDSILEDVIKLKEEIKKSKEYINYKKSLNKIENDKKINILIKKIKNIQKEIVNKEAKKINTEKEEAILSILFTNLFEIKEYSEYIDNSRKLNELLSNIQYKFSMELNKILGVE